MKLYKVTKADSKHSVADTDFTAWEKPYMDLKNLNPQKITAGEEDKIIRGLGSLVDLCNKKVDEIRKIRDIRKKTGISF